MSDRELRHEHTKIATPVMRIAVGISDVICPNSLGTENLVRP